VDRRTGVERWRFDTDELLPWEWGFEGWDVYTSSPVVSDSIVVFGAGDGVVYALEIETGNELWRLVTEGRVRASPAIADGIVFVGSTDGRAYALELPTGAERWRFETDGVKISSEDQGVDRRSIIASPTVADGTVFVGSRDGYMYALDRETGEEKWRVSHDGSWAMSSPAVLGNMVYAGTSDGRFVHAVNAESGEEEWRFVGEGYTWSSPCVAGNTVFIGDGAGYLRAVALDSGLERWNYPVSDGVYSSPVVDDGVVFFGADDGYVYALHGDGTYPHRAVFWDEDFEAYTIFRSHVETRVFFAQHGYQVLDTDALNGFLESRITDRDPSVVVFAMDYVSLSMIAEPGDTVLLRRYLDAGGKVVWLDLPPMVLIRNDSGRVTALDRNRPENLLGVDHSDFNFDFYAAIPTDLGREWGLERGWVGSYSVPLSESIEVLARDENGRAAAWVRHYGGSAGTGFVGIGMDHASDNALEAVHSVAEYGIGGRIR
jgi:outer membrane protein assembly factor BamB